MPHQSLPEPLTKDDIPELERLDSLCFPENRSFTKGYFYLLFLYDEAFGWGIREEGKLVAFILLTRKRERINIATIDVHPANRRLGLGRQLIRHAMAEFRNTGARRLTLQVETTNEPAISLYASFGFATVKKLPGYYVDGDALLMEKTL